MLVSMTRRANTGLLLSAVDPQSVILDRLKRRLLLVDVGARWGPLLDWNNLGARRCGSARSGSHRSAASFGDSTPACPARLRCIGRKRPFRAIPQGDARASLQLRLRTYSHSLHGLPCAGLHHASVKNSANCQSAPNIDPLRGKTPNTGNAQYVNAELPRTSLASLP